MKANLPVCPDCRFCSKVPNNALGTCHRYAPRPGERTETWPVVTADMWCGEFEPNYSARAAEGSAIDD
jgi:hypothetical protein